MPYHDDVGLGSQDGRTGLFSQIMCTGKKVGFKSYVSESAAGIADVCVGSAETCSRFTVTLSLKR
jgi:hypothetical protein